MGKADGLEYSSDHEPQTDDVSSRSQSLPALSVQTSVTVNFSHCEQGRW
jgi:hypothetical protein